MADIDEFRRFKVDQLRTYCQQRGLSVTNYRKKDELVALAFAACCQGLPVISSKADDKADASHQFRGTVDAGRRHDHSRSGSLGRRIVLYCNEFGRKDGTGCPNKIWMDRIKEGLERRKVTNVDVQNRNDWRHGMKYTGLDERRIGYPGKPGQFP